MTQWSLKIAYVACTINFILFIYANMYMYVLTCTKFTYEIAVFLNIMLPVLLTFTNANKNYNVCIV